MTLQPVKTLVLASDYEPIRVISWQRAVKLWFAERADVVEVYQNHVAHSPSTSINIPSVIVIKKYIRKNRGVASAYSKENVYRRDKYRCQYCMNRFARSELTIDHVIPKSKGGQTTWENTVTACRSCNNRKGSSLLNTRDDLSLSKSPKAFTGAFRLDTVPQILPTDWKPYLAYYKDLEELL